MVGGGGGGGGDGGGDGDDGDDGGNFTINPSLIAIRE